MNARRLPNKSLEISMDAWQAKSQKRSRSLLGHRRFQALALQEAFRSGFRIAAEGLSTSSTEIYGVPGGVPPASGTGRGRFTIHRFGSADLRRCGSRQSIEAGCCGRDVYLT